MRQETPDAVSVAFTVPEHLKADYSFSAGQYLTLRADFEGAEVRRTYSICSGEDDGELRIAIRRIEGGIFSPWAQEALKAGMELEVMTPTGRFGVRFQPRSARLHAGFVAGSGITPVLSVLKTVLRREPKSRFFVFYGSRTSHHILFRTELEDLKDQHLGRLAVFHVLSREQQDVEVLNGRLEKEKLQALLGPMLGGTRIDEAYVCGPFGMIDNICGLLDVMNVAPEHLHVERFTSALGGRPRRAPAEPPEQKPFAVASITFNGARTEVPVRGDEAILDAALRAGLDLPYACKGGMCCTCRAMLLQGKAQMAQNYSLEAWEMAAGFILTCQARPLTSRLEVDYDQQ